MAKREKKNWPDFFGCSRPPEKKIGAVSCSRPTLFFFVEVVELPLEYRKSIRGSVWIFRGNKKDGNVDQPTGPPGGNCRHPILGVFQTPHFLWRWMLDKKRITGLRGKCPFGGGRLKRATHSSNRFILHLTDFPVTPAPLNWWPVDGNWLRTPRTIRVGAEPGPKRRIFISTLGLLFFVIFSQALLFFSDSKSEAIFTGWFLFYCLLYVIQLNAEIIAGMLTGRP